MSVRLKAYRWRTVLDWRAEALTLALIVAESAIAYLYLGVLLPDLRPPYTPFPAWLILVLLLAAYALPHLLELGHIWGGRFEATLIVATALSLALTIKVAAFPDAPLLALDWLRQTAQALIVRPNDAVRPVWALVLVVAYAWWRGRTRAEASLDLAFQMLRWGTLATAGALLLVLLAAPEGSPLADRMSLAVIVFFSATLTALGFARLRLEGIRSSSPLGGNWLATFALPIAGIVLVAVVAAAVLSHRFLVTMLVILGPFFWLAGLLLRLLVVVVALMAFVVIAPLLWLLEREGFGQASGERMPQLMRGLNDFRAYAATRLDVADPLRYLIAALVLFLLASALTRYVYRRRRRWRQTARERRESVFVLEDALGSLGQTLRRLLRPVRRIDSLARLRGDPRWAHTIAIRETYKRLQDWGERGGTAQVESVTPDEYERVLAARFPAGEVAIVTIVRAYDAARYSGEPATSEQAEHVRQAWSTLRRAKG